MTAIKVIASVAD